MNGPVGQIAQRNVEMELKCAADHATILHLNMAVTRVKETPLRRITAMYIIVLVSDSLLICLAVATLGM